jgi:hypothetical protein
MTYYTTAAFRGAIIGGAHQPVDGEFAELRYYSQSECERLHMSPPSRIISRQAFASANQAYFAPASWAFPKVG